MDVDEAVAYALEHIPHARSTSRDAVV